MLPEGRCGKGEESLKHGQGPWISGVSEQTIPDRQEGGGKGIEVTAQTSSEEDISLCPSWSHRVLCKYI